MATSSVQPDQQPERWNDFVRAYEEVFEPCSLGFAEPAIASLGLEAGRRVLDVGCGSGGAAIRMAAQGCVVTAIDAATRMVERTRERAGAAGVSVDARVMDGMALSYADAAFDAALSVLGVILFPDPVAGLSEMRRVVRRGGRVAVVTWTEPQQYELAATLRAAVESVWPDQPASPLPAQLRYREAADFRALFAAAGCADVEIAKVTSTLRAPSAGWLGDRIAFAPGLSALVSGLGERRPAAMAAFVDRLERRFGAGPVRLSGVAFVGIANVA
jgi:ubiquinone/menaquinone biosynthesis C-methylase UbiE